MSLRNSIVVSSLGAFCAFSGTAQCAEPSITGITLGSSLEQVKAAIGPGFDLQDHGKSPDGAVQRWVEVKPFEAYSIMLLNNRVIFLDHYQGFTQQTKPSAAATISALTGKYGTASWTYVNTGLTWFYDAHGAVVRQNANDLNTPLRACDTISTSSENVQMPPNPDKTPYQGPGGVFVSFPSGASSTCPITLQALIHIDDLMQLQVYIYDQRPYFDYLKAARDKQQADQRAVEAGNKPRL